MNVQDFFWQIALQIPPLTPEQVHIWAWDLDSPPLPSNWQLLSEEETRRAQRFVYGRDRDRYVRAHFVMRKLLASYAHVQPAEIAFFTNAYGKPQMHDQMHASQGTHQIHFNLSHSAGIALLAVSLKYELGVDLEALRPIDPEIAEKYFSALESNALRSLPPDQWLHGFYRCWTSKEALMKGEGLGLNLPLDAFDVEVDPQLPPALLSSRPQVSIAPDWRLIDLRPAPDAVGILAIRNGAEAAIRCFAFSE